MAKKICTYKSATTCGHIENRLTPCPTCPFHKTEPMTGPPGPPGPPGEAVAVDPALLEKLIRRLVGALPVKQGEKGEKGDTVIGPTGLTGPPGLSIQGLPGSPGASVKGEKGTPGKVDEEELKKLILNLLERLRPQLLLGWGARAKHGNLPDVTSGQHHVAFVQADADLLYDALGGLAAHVAAGNPHAIYLTKAEADALYDVLGGLAGHVAAGDPHSAYALDSDLTTHAGAADPHTGYQKESEKDAANGYAGLSAGSKIALSQLQEVLAYADLTDDPVGTHEAAGDPHAGYQQESEKGAANGYMGLDASQLGTDLPKLHAATHQNAGDDEVNVAGLSGELADDQPPKAHAPESHTGTDITAVELETLSDTSDADALHNHPSDLTPAEHTAIGDGAPHHAEAHAPESHTGTDITAVELEDLSDGGETAIHSHAGGGGGYDTIEEEGAPVAQRTTIDFVGTGATATDVGAETRVSIPGTPWAALQTFNAGIATDAIAEKTPTLGVTIDGVLLKDSNAQLVYLKDIFGNNHLLLSPAGVSIFYRDLRVDDALAIGSAPTATELVKASAAGSKASDFVIISAVTGGLALTGNDRKLVGLRGEILNTESSGATGAMAYGLRFAAYVGSGGGGATAAEVMGIWVRTGTAVYTGTIDILKGISIEGAYYVGGTPVTTLAYGLHVGNFGSHAGTVDAYGIKIEDTTLNSGFSYLLEVGPATPYIRVVGQAAPGAGLTNVYIREQANLRRVQWMDPGVGGVNFAGGERVVILV